MELLQVFGCSGTTASDGSNWKLDGNLRFKLVIGAIRLRLGVAITISLLWQNLNLDPSKP
jgi:hypothetical protein